MKLNQQSLRTLEADVGAEILPLILEQFKQELKGRAEKLWEASRNQDIAAVQAESHSVKATARTVGLDQVADVAESAEAAASNADAENALRHARELASLCEQGCALFEVKQPE